MKQNYNESEVIADIIAVKSREKFGPLLHELVQRTSHALKLLFYLALSETKSLADQTELVFRFTAQLVATTLQRLHDQMIVQLHSLTTTIDWTVLDDFSQIFP